MLLKLKMLLFHAFRGPSGAPWTAQLQRG